jgi:hypothetical protein
MTGWHYPKDNGDTDNMPPVGQQVILVYEIDGKPQGPVVFSLCDEPRIYNRIVRWHVIPEE